MTSKRSAKLKKATIIGAVVFVVMAIVFCVLSVTIQNEAEIIKEDASMYDKTAAAQAAMLESTGSVMLWCGIIFVVGGILIATLLLGIYYRTDITITDGFIKGVGVIGLKRTNFAASVTEIQTPSTNGKNLLQFTIDGKRYSVYTDEANTLCQKLMEISKK